VEARVGERHDPACLARAVEPHLCGVDVGTRAQRLDGAVCVRGDEVEVTPTSAAVALGLADAALVVGEDRDSLPDRTRRRPQPARARNPNARSTNRARNGMTLLASRRDPLS